jgi:glycolate oxidase iron-sulfur subunit
MSTLAAEEQKLLACVHCGLCLEACPTYVVTGNENDSPRGRLYLMRAVGEGRISKDAASFKEHIDRCLGCRACESACPAGVQYGELLEASRAELFDQAQERGFVHSSLRFVLRHVWLQQARLKLAFALGRLARETKLTRLLLKTRIARSISPRFEFALALLESSRGQSVNHSSPRRGEKPVMIFKGCVTEGLFSRVNQATARVLSVNGYKVEQPDQQVCCGALHAHAGDLEGARELARQNLQAFGNQDVPIITNAGGCGAMLLSYGHLLSDDEPFAADARKFSARVRDVSQQLEATEMRRGAAIEDKRVTYDASCHLLYGQRAADAPLKMLASIPHLNLVPLPGSERCCGGAGVYNLLERDLSGDVLAEKLRNIESTGAELVATGNPGCHMQIGAGAMLSDLPVSMCHPIELVDESYRRAGLYEEVEDQHR